MELIYSRQRSTQQQPTSPTHVQCPHRTYVKERLVINDEPGRKNGVTCFRQIQVFFAYHDGHTHIWHPRGEGTLPACIRYRHTGLSPGVMVWAAMRYTSRSPLVRILGTLNTTRHLYDVLKPMASGLASVLADAHPSTFFSGGTLTAQRYRNEILEPYLRPYRDQIGHNLIFMDDNARPHRARLVNEYLQSENIRRMDWPAISPDLNPIEHVWDALGRRIGARHPSPRTLVELRTALLEEWGLLPLDLLQSLPSDPGNAPGLPEGPA
ncbi:hypothetical protein LAZ67_11002297, partial [Cordylochernes scorpioides]